MAIQAATKRTLIRAMGLSAEAMELTDAIDAATTVIAASVATPAGNTTHSIKFTASDGTVIYVPGYAAATF